MGQQKVVTRIKAPKRNDGPHQRDGDGRLGSATGQPARKPSQCPCCGRKSVVPAAGPGRVRRYRNTVLTLPADLLVPTCRRCKHVFLTFEAVPGLAACLEATYRANLCQRAAAEIVRLRQSYSQRYVEVELDLSQGYLSRLRAGDGVPSAALVSLLALLAADPARLKELQRYWAGPVEDLSGADDGDPVHDPQA